MENQSLERPRLSPISPQGLGLGLALSERQLAMLDCMGIALHGWRSASAPPPTPVPALKLSSDAAPSPTPFALKDGAPKALGIDTSRPENRKQSLGQLRQQYENATQTANHPPQAANLIEESANIAEKPARAAPLFIAKNQAQAPTASPSAEGFTLWDVHGKAQTQAQPQGWLLVLDHAQPQNAAPKHAEPAEPALPAESLTLLRNILQALQWPEAQVQIALLPAAEQFSSALCAKQIQAWQPSRILILGRAGARHLLGQTQAVGQLRGQAHTVHGIPAFISYPLDHLLRSPENKAKAWQDWLQLKWSTSATPAATPALISPSSAG